MGKRRLNVLFLCTGNSARSILAEALVNRSGRGRIKAFSAGSDPKGFVHPAALQLLQRLRFETARLRSKSWDEFTAADAPAMDAVITLCDSAGAESCPVWPGHPLTALWSTEDPAIEGTPDEATQAFAHAFQSLRARVSQLMGLPLARLSDDELLRKLREIGASSGTNGGGDVRLSL